MGCIDIPYENEGRDADPSRKRKRGQGSSRGAPTTTAQVAQILEDKYGVMRVFYDNNKDAIEAAVVHSVEGALEDLFLGAPVKDPFAEAGAEVASGFREFLLSGQIEQLGVEGVPTQAAQDRRSLRFKSKRAKAQRPSFIDTGLYELSARAWVE